MIGSNSCSFFSENRFGQGFVLQFFSKIFFPEQGFPPLCGGTQILCKNCLPPPQANVHWLQS